MPLSQNMRALIYYIQKTNLNSFQYKNVQTIIEQLLF